MKILSIIIAVMIAAYLGQVFGLTMQAHSIKQLKHLRGYTAYVPFLVLNFILYLLFKSDCEDKLKTTLKFIFLIENKAVLIGAAVSISIQEYLENHPQASRARVRKCIPLINSNALESIGGALAPA